MKYVILHHITTSEHYDIMFEKEDFLLTYSMGTGLINDFLQGNEVTIQRITDHRLLYLDYEGHISGNRGRVAQFDAGSYYESQHKQESVVYKINGRKLSGTIEIKNIDGTKYTIRYNNMDKVK